MENDFKCRFNRWSGIPVSTDQNQTSKANYRINDKAAWQIIVDELPCVDGKSDFDPSDDGRSIPLQSDELVSGDGNEVIADHDARTTGNRKWE